MAILPVRIYGDPVLKKRAAEVTVFGESLRRLIADLRDTMGAYHGVGLAATQVGRSWTTLFVSAVFAGALITAMTWFVEGQETMGVRVVAAWLAAALLVLGNFDHVIVVSLELLFGMRFGAHVPWSFWFENLGLAAAGNMVGGIGLVTVNRFTQARSSRSASG